MTGQDDMKQMGQVVEWHHKSNFGVNTSQNEAQTGTLRARNLTLRILHLELVGSKAQMYSGDSAASLVCLQNSGMIHEKPVPWDFHCRSQRNDKIIYLPI